jgi:hypothetical protein
MAHAREADRGQLGVKVARKPRATRSSAQTTVFLGGANTSRPALGSSKTYKSVPLSRYGESG